MRDYVKELNGMDLFGKIQEQEINSVLSCLGAMARQYKKGEFIFLEGEYLDCIGAVMRGTVQMIKEDVWGQKSILLTMERGAVFGESFVCGDRKGSTVSFLAAADCRILLMNFHKVMKTCSAACVYHQRLVENMVILLARRNVQLMDKMEIISKKTIRGRILTWMSQQVQEQGSRRFVSPLGRLELADYLCVDRSALTRELGKMQEEGLLDYDKNLFELKEWDC